MSERHSSSQTPLPPQARDARFAERRLQPLSERIMGLPAYGNAMGKRFTANLRVDDSSPFCLEYKLEIAEVAPDRKGYKVVADLIVNHEALYIDSIRGSDAAKESLFCAEYERPPEDWRGFGFLSIILDYAKMMAMRYGKPAIELSAANDDLVRFYEKHGFVLKTTGKFRTMAYEIGEGRAKA